MPLFVEDALMVLLVLLECEHVLPVFWERFMILDHIEKVLVQRVL